jgi:hypothetical protein
MAGLYYKEDWAEAQVRFSAWWQGEVVDRVALAVRAPRRVPIGPTADLPVPASLLGYWTDPDYRVGQAERVFARTAYLGEACPCFQPVAGPGVVPLFLGSQPTLDLQTMWYEPILSDLSSPPALRFDPAGEWWQRTRRLVAEGAERGRGRFLTTQPNLVEGFDVLAALRGQEAFLLDLADYPEAVHAGLKQLTDLYFRGYDALYELIAPATPGGGCASHYQVWGPGRVAKVQCDLGAMISPRTFAEFVLPYLDEQCRQLDYALYHLDGPHAIRHVDMLLGLASLRAIQWMPGAGVEGPESSRWYGLYRRILAAGKSVLLLDVPPDAVEPLVGALGPEGLLITTTASSEETGLRLLDAARHWTRARA